LINNRQAGRRRGRGGQRAQGGNSGRPDNGNRIDNRARGNAAQLLEKYKSLARDAQMQGDRVNTEYYLQFADHYFRVLNESRSRFEESQQRRGGANEAFDEEADEDFDGDGFAEDRVDGERAQQANGNRRDYGNREQGGRDQGGRDQGSRDGGRRESADGYRDANRDGRDQGRGEPRGAGRDGFRNQGRSSDPRDVDGEPRSGDDSGHAAPTRDAEAAAAGNPMAAPMADADAQRPRRGRPRRAAAPVADTAADEPAAIEIDRLPPALSLSATVTDAEPADDAKPRRRRRAPAAETTPAD